MSERLRQKNTATGHVVDPTLHNMVTDGVRAATSLANSEGEFNYHCADSSMRNLAGLCNGLSTQYRFSLSKLPVEDFNRLKDLTGDTLAFLYDNEAKQKVDEQMQLLKPADKSEACDFVIRQAFNAMQVKVSIGPDTSGEHGYKPETEPQVRNLTLRYAQVFASTYMALSGMEHPITTPRNRDYFRQNIQQAQPYDFTDRPRISATII
jgi:hypothetical protein